MILDDLDLYIFLAAILIFVLFLALRSKKGPIYGLVRLLLKGLALVLTLNPALVYETFLEEKMN